MKIHNGFFGFMAMQSFSSYLCHYSPYSEKKCGHRKVSHQPNDNNITQNKGSNFIHHSIIYCEERDKKPQKTASSTSDDLSEQETLSSLSTKVMKYCMPCRNYNTYTYSYEISPLTLFPLSLSNILIIIHLSITLV